MKNEYCTKFMKGLLMIVNDWTYSFSIKIKLFLLTCIVLSFYESNGQISASTTSTVSTCNANGTIKVNVIGGTSPYIYEIISGPSGFSRPAQNNNFFDQLPPGNYTVQVRDNGGRQTNTTASVIGFYKEPTITTCAPLPLTSSIEIKAIDGLSPYRFNYSANGGTTWSPFETDSIFKCLPDGNYIFRLTDACENFYPCYSTINILPPQFEYKCGKNVDGFVDIDLKRLGDQYGELPIKYTVITVSGEKFENNVGVFKNIPGCRFTIQSTDKCGRTFEIENVFCGEAELKYEIECVNYKDGSASIRGVGGIPPYKFTEMNSGNVSSDGIFEGLPVGDTYHFIIEDDCENNRHFYISEPKYNFYYSVCEFDSTLDVSTSYYNYVDDSSSCDGFLGCQFNFYPINITCQDCNPVQEYTVKENSPLYSFSQQFKDLELKTYNFLISDSCGNQWLRTVDLRDGGPIMVVTPTCESIDISICPADPGYTYYLYDSLGAFLKESTEPYFSGLNSGTVYQVKSFNPTISLDTLDFLVKTNTLAPKYIPNNITCSSFDIVPEGFIWDVFDSTIYELYDMSGLLLKSSFSPSFDSLSAGQYRFRVYHRTCGERFNTVIIPEPKKPEICIGPDYIYNPNSGRKEFAWKIKYGPTAKNINISGNQYTQYQRSYDYEGVHELILLPGKYFTKSNCLLDTFDLPSYNFKLNLQVSGMCPGFGKIIPGGWPTDAEWEAFFEPLGLKFCPSRGPVYLIFDKDWNQLTSFQNLPSGEVYNVVMTSFGAAPLDTIKVASPFYFRPNLSSTFGAVCSSSPVGSVVLSSNGGTPPFTFQMLNPPSGQEIITRDSIAQFNNLPAGSYTFRVFDSCGISSDFATSVDALNFVPYYRRFCDGNIQLFAPNVTNATYLWVNSINQKVGDTYQPVIKDTGAEEYTVTISTSTCTFTKSLEVPAQSVADITANAGNDITAFESAIELNAIQAPDWADSYWTTITPSSGNTVFGNINAYNSTIEVSQVPGQYTYLWTVDGGPNGCIDYDTLVASFYNCTNVNNFSIQTNSNNSSCFVANGSALVRIDPPTGNYKIRWSNGINNAEIANLRPGNYTVTVSDDDVCTLDQKDTVVILGRENIVKNQKASICQGEVFNVGASKYTVSGIYYDTLRNFLRCDSVVVTELTVNPVYQIHISSTICEKDSFVFNNRVLYLEGIYTALFQSVFGCDSTVVLNLNVSPQKYTTLQKTICDNESFQLGSKFISEEGQYIDTLKSQSNCDSIVALTLLVNPTNQTFIMESFCEGTIYLFDTLEIENAGSYVLSYSNYLGCDSLVFLELNEIPLPNINLGLDTFLCAGWPVELNANIMEGVNVYWEGGINGVNYIASKPGNYVAVGENECGIDSDTIYVALGCDGCDAHVPKAFSPNQDRINDIFRPIYTCTPETSLFSVFDRWGILVFQTDTYTEGWNGIYKGSQSMTDGFIWHLEFSYTFNNKLYSKSSSGVVALLR